MASIKEAENSGENWIKHGGILAAARVRLAKDGSSFDVYPTYSDSDHPTSHVIERRRTDKVLSFFVCEVKTSIGAHVHREHGNAFDVYPTHGSGPIFKVETLHISSKSDTYCGKDRKYGGIIIYGLSSLRSSLPSRPREWHTANGTHCKSGYVVIIQTDTSEFQELQNKWSSEPGRVHGVIYRKAFGESLNDVKAVGEGFGIIDDEFKITSGALNPARGDDYHDDSPLMNEDSARYVGALVKIWKDAGPNFPARQNYTVKELAD